MKFLALFLLVAVVSAERVRYDGFKVFKVQFETEDQFEKLFDLKVNSQNQVLDVWQLSRAEKTADIMVNPELVDSFVNFLKENKFQYDLTIDNLQKTMEKNE